MIGNDRIKNILHDENFKISDTLDELIELSLKEKEKFVKNDIQESSNRLYLNFGHTIGHAIEFSTIFNGEESLRHGEGVGLGMISVFRIAIQLGYLLETDLVLLKTLLSKFGLPTSFSAKSLGLSRDALIDRVVSLSLKDKKRIKSDLRMILLDGVGKPFIYKTSNTELIASGVSEVILWDQW